MFYFILKKLYFFFSILIVIFILLCISIFTLIERKVMSSVQRRKGPYLRGLLGFLQPFADGLKLLIKEIIILSNFLILYNSYFFYYLNIFNYNFLSTNYLNISTNRFHLNNNKLMFSSTKRFYSNEPKKIKCIIKKRSLSSYLLKWLFIENIKYDKVLNIFDSNFTCDEKNIIFEGFLKDCHYIFASEIDDHVDASEQLDSVFCKTVSLNHYSFYLNDEEGISLNIPDMFLGNILIIEIKKIKIFSKKRTFYCYYVFFLKEVDILGNVYIRRLSEVELDDKLILTVDCDILVCRYFPPYEVLKDSFFSKKDYDSFIKSSGKIIFDLDEIINLDELVENFLTVSDREEIIYNNYLNKINENVNNDNK